MNKLIDTYFPVLDHGYISLKEVMGNDAAIVQAARVSYGKGTKTKSDDENLIRYLIRNKHCYHPNMEVLTDEGWKKWKDCKNYENFAVPNVNNRTFHFAKCAVVKYKYNGKMCCYKNNRMSYSVTPNHRMFFSPRSQNNQEYKIIEAEHLPRYGHFDTLSGYKLSNSEPITEKDYSLYNFIGFFSGDGYWISTNKIGFRLQKQRKIDYLNRLLKLLEWEFSVRDNIEGDDCVKIYVINFDKIILNYLNFNSNSDNKNININSLTIEKANAIFDGLKNSDGSIKQERKQIIAFSSNSQELIKKFELLSFCLGRDCHSVQPFVKNKRCVSYNETGRTTLEARKQYFYDNENFDGTVYCATTDTGLLIVRGNYDEFAFICGNSTPLEMVVFKFHISMPIFCHRQFIRHRMSSTNEYSMRYSEAPDVFYTPTKEIFNKQSDVNKQGRSDEEVDQYEYYMRDKELLRGDLFDHYKEQLKDDVSRELARIDLPLSLYTYFYWKIDLHNLFHFLRLRCDEHAQWEIRQYANILAGIVKETCPLAFGGWYDYIMCGANFSREELRFLIEKLTEESQTPYSIDDNSLNLTKREREEFKQKTTVLKSYNFDLPWEKAYRHDESDNG